MISMPPVIEIKNISKTFRSASGEAFSMRNVSFDVDDAEIFSLLGPNGAGKTTLLNMIVGILVPDSGSITLFGKNVQKDANVLEQVGFGSGETRFQWVLRVADILQFYARIYGLAKEEREKRIAELVSFFGLHNVLHRKFGYLSTGERMRLVFAKALLNNPKLLLLDEPTLGLDPEIALRVRHEIKRINKTFGTTILLTSHYMQEVEQLSDRIAFIYEGSIVDIGSVEKVKLKHFSTYELTIKVKKIKNASLLKKLGFHVHGTFLKKTMNTDDDMNFLLSQLVKNGFEVLHVESKKPTLEDYFVKMMGVKRKQTGGEEQ